MKNINFDTSVPPEVEELIDLATLLYGPESKDNLMKIAGSGIAIGINRGLEEALSRMEES